MTHGMCLPTVTNICRRELPHFHHGMTSSFLKSRPIQTPPSGPEPKTIKKNTNSTHNKYLTQRARAYEVTSLLSTDCELSTNPCSRFLYSLGPRAHLCRWSRVHFGLSLCHATQLIVHQCRSAPLPTICYEHLVARC